MGSTVAPATPMDEKGKVCRSSLKKLVDYYAASGTLAIVSVGTTGESVTLSYDEYGDVVTMTLELADGCIPVIAGTGANVTAEAVSLTQRFNGSGITGCLTVTPYYNHPTQGGLFQHFKAIVEHTDLPQILYNVPSCTGCDTLPETVGRPAKVKNIIAIKRTMGSLNRAHQIKEPVLGDFILLSGDDAIGLDFMQFGGHGVIPVTSNVATRDMAKICKLTAAGRFTEARVINQCLMPLHNELFVESNPIPVKWACKELGLMATDTLRLSMMPITDNACEIVKVAFKHAGLL